jgi:hypothetical protein
MKFGKNIKILNVMLILGLERWSNLIATKNMKTQILVYTQDQSVGIKSLVKSIIHSLSKSIK